MEKKLPQNHGAGSARVKVICNKFAEESYKSPL